LRDLSKAYAEFAEGIETPDLISAHKLLERGADG